MIALQVSVDGVHVCTSGIGDDGVLTTGVTWVGSGGEGSHDLHIGGLDSRTDEHVQWEAPPVGVGSTVQIRVIESATADPPKSHESSDPETRADAYRRILRRFAEDFTPDERKQLVREYLAELERLDAS